MGLRHLASNDEWFGEDAAAAKSEEIKRQKFLEPCSESALSSESKLAM